MLKIGLIGLLMAAALAPATARAQKGGVGPAAQPAPQQAAPAQREDARAAADRLIAHGQGGAASWFVNVTRSGGPATVMHRRSGLTCVFDAQPVRGELVAYPASGSAMAGDDVSCNMLNAAGRSFLETLYVTRYIGGSFEQHYQGAVAEIRSRFGQTPQWTPSRPDTADPGLPPCHTIRFQVIMDGRPSYTRLSICQVGPWTVMLRFSAPIEQADAADQAAGRAFRDAVMQVARGSST